MPKLTLSVDASVVARAKRYAAGRGTSISRLVEDYLDLLAGRPKDTTAQATPLLKRLQRGLAGHDLDIRSHREHLARKYR